MRIFYKFILFAITITSFALNANIDCGLATSEGDVNRHMHKYKDKR